MNKIREIVKLKSGVIYIPESLYNDTHEDFKGASVNDKTKRTWMPPCELLGITCLLVEGNSFKIIPDLEFIESFRPEGKFYKKHFTVEGDDITRIYCEV